MPKYKSSRQLKKENEKLQNEVTRLKDEQHQMSLSLSKHDHQHIHNVTVSDLPTPEAYSAYPKELQELILLRIQTDIENDKKMLELEEKEQSIRNKETTGEISIKTRGQFFAFFALLFLGGLAAYFANLQAFKISAAIVGVTIVGSITAFTGFGRPKSK